MVSQLFSLTTSNHGCQNQGNPTPGDVVKRASNKAHPFQVSRSAQRVSYETSGLSTSSGRVPRCTNQGYSSLPVDGLSRRAPQKVHRIPMNTLRSCLPALMILMVLSRPISAASGSQRDKTRPPNGAENFTPRTREAARRVQKLTAEIKYLLIEQIQQWSWSRLDEAQQSELVNEIRKSIPKSIEREQMPENYDLNILSLRDSALDNVPKDEKEIRKSLYSRGELEKMSPKQLSAHAQKCLQHFMGTYPNMQTAIEAKMSRYKAVPFDKKFREELQKTREIGTE